MKQGRLAGILLALTVMLTACGWQGTGVIVSKRYTEAYQYISFICSSYNAQGICAVQVPITNYVPAYYYVGVKVDTDGKTRDISVNLDYWNASKVGDQFDNRDKGK